MRYVCVYAFFVFLGALMAVPPAKAEQGAHLPPLIRWKGASEALIAKPQDPWITPVEAAGFVSTPDYATTRAWLDKLVAASGGLLTLEEFGHTAQGRALYFVRASKGGAGKPIVLAQAGIHSGEIDGKDAGLMLLRDIALRGKDSLLDHADLVFVPIFNADGHERASPFNRPNQRGPANQGWRTTAQNLNLNRDYLKADSPEMQAMIGLLRRLGPALYLDLHVTDGTDYQYDITYAFSGWKGYYAASPAIGAWLDGRFRPAIDAALSKNGHVPGYYVSAVDNRDPDKGISHDPDTARFSNGYGDLARIPTVLLETHSLKPYRQRVLGTYVFVEAALRLAGDQREELRAAIAKDRAARPIEAVLTWKPIAAPIYTIENFKGMAFERYRSAASGREEIRWLGKPKTQSMPVFGFAPDFTAKLPIAWWIPPTAIALIERVKLHGIAFETLTQPRKLRLDRVRLLEPELQGANEGHVPLRAKFRHEMLEEEFPAGSLRVPSAQPLGLLAAHLLEAEGPDSLLAWNYFPEILQRTEYIEGYVIAPLAEAMLARDAQLKSAFEAKLAADPAFAADGDARLAWFYERSPYYDARFLLYPVGREMAGP
jgi:murein tripeptide amidase MpaA